MSLKILITISTIFASFMGWSQATVASKNMGFYFSPSLQAGYNLGNSIRNNQNRDSAYYQEFVKPYLANDFTYGIAATVGWQAFSFFGIGTGIGYNYIAYSLHLLSWTVQPRFFIGKDNDGKAIVELEFGKQFNQANVSDSKHYAIKLGYQESFSKRLNQEYGLFLRSNQFQSSNAVFIGAYLSAIIFTHKNYTVYGKD